MIIILQIFKIIIVYKLFNICCGVLLNSYYYQIINNYEKLIDKINIKNIFKINILIFLAIYIYIKLIKFLKNNIFNIKYNIKRKFYK